LRASLLKSKKASLTQTQVISGLGGIGKTQTALEYAYRHREDYRYIFWVRADTHELLTSDFAAMASALDLPVKDDKDQNLAVNAASLATSTATNNAAPCSSTNTPDSQLRCNREESA
jgi:MinD superfamily P-loop ATPase